MPSPSERNLSNFKVSESFWRLMQTDPVDDRTLIDGTGSLVTYLVVSGTLEAFYFKGDGSQITNLNLSGSNLVSSSNQIVSSLIGQVLTVDTLIAQQYVVSSSVSYITESFSSGSTRFGDSLDDIHQFTGSLYVLGGITGSISTASINNFDIEVSRSIANYGFGATLPPGVVSSSAQTIYHLVGTNIVSGSGQRSILGLGVSDNVVFGNVSSSGIVVNGNAYIDGTLTARTYVVSSSIVNITTQDISGSTKFGDTLDDRHQYTGSLFVTGSVYAGSFIGVFEGAISSSQQLYDLGFTTGSLTSVYWNDILSKPANIISGSGQRSILGLGTTDSPTFGNIYATNANFNGNVLVDGTITARTYVVSSSIVNIITQDVSGSTIFGDSIDDYHQITGSVFISGSLIVPTKMSLPAITITGSLALNGNDLYIYV